MLGKKWDSFFKQKFFHYGFSRNVLSVETERTFDIDICDLLTTLSTFRIGMFCIFLDVKKQETN